MKSLCSKQLQVSLNSNSKMNDLVSLSVSDLNQIQGGCIPDFPEDIFGLEEIVWKDIPLCP